ncbi:hypothetical protein GCM10023191_007760 [Actinoallomurus oryzae]|uniref:Restriction endonuclease type IV Mrr domain-containing protein n=1 Tax=Actinoallomurus oryzae TaxID=502180 RepID=A0ABP8PCJ2_9ACTN
MSSHSGLKPTDAQLALWGQEIPLTPPSNPLTVSTLVYDYATISLSDSTDDRKARVNKKLTINGEFQSLSRYPSFQSLKKRSILNTLPGLDGLPTLAQVCPYCRIELDKTQGFKAGTDESDRCSGYFLEYCQKCYYWQVNELRMQSWEARGTLVYEYDIAILSAKLREFSTETPKGSLSEICQWFKRHPERYHSVSPLYMELLVARVFDEVGTYVEVRHVGRPGDGGVDVFLVDAEDRSWLVQVKRREYARSTEPVSTIRNVLGSMVLERAKHAVVVSTADHFTYHARQAATRAKKEGFTLELVDRKALDQLLEKSIRSLPWKGILHILEEDRNRWLEEDWCFCGCVERRDSIQLGINSAD